jgi:hypothetical protein
VTKSDKGAERTRKKDSKQGVESDEGSERDDGGRGDAVGFDHGPSALLLRACTQSPARRHPCGGRQRAEACFPCNGSASCAGVPGDLGSSSCRDASAWKRRRIRGRSGAFGRNVKRETEAAEALGTALATIGRLWRAPKPTSEALHLHLTRGARRAGPAPSPGGIVQRLRLHGHRGVGRSWANSPKTPSPPASNRRFTDGHRA